MAVDKLGKLRADGRVLRQVEVRLKHKYIRWWARGLGVELDIPDPRCAILRESDVAAAFGGLMERFRGSMRTYERRQLRRSDVFILEQRE